MSRLIERLRFVVVTPGLGDVDALGALARAAFEGGATSLWIRERTLSEDELKTVIRAFQGEARKVGGGVIVSDRDDLVMEEEALAVHLGMHSPAPETVARRITAGTHIGFSAHEGSEPMVPSVCDYVTLSPLFMTKSKTGSVEPLGPERFSQICQQLDVPVLALGGIDETNVRVALDAGADGVVVMSAVTDAPDPCIAAKRIARAMADARL